MMDRLSYKDCSYCELVNCQSDSCKRDILCLGYKVYEKLKHYEDLEEQGLLLRLPCKVGDTVYIVGDRFPAIIDEIRIAEDNHIMFEFIEYDKSYELTEVWDSGGFELEDIGKTVFLTREEAEVQRIKRGKWTQPDKDCEWNDYYICSECGNIEDGDALSMNYCSECGAKMESD